MKKTKRIISIALALVMVFSLCSMSASAVEKVSINLEEGDLYWPTFGSGKIKSMHIALCDNRITKISEDAVAKVYFCPDERISIGDNLPEIDIEDEVYDEIDVYWENPEFFASIGKVEYIGEVTAADMYIGENDFRDFGTYNPFLGIENRYNSIHIDLRDLNLRNDFGDYAIIFEEGSLTSEDGTVVNERFVASGFMNLSKMLTGIYRLSYIYIVIFSIFNFKFLFKGY